MSVRALGAGLAGGLLAGALVGGIEAVASWFGAHGVGDLPPIAWGMIVYGLVGAAGGIGAGIVAMILRTDGFGLALAGIGTGLGFVVARFRIIRDVFMEQLPPGALTQGVQLAALLATIVVAFLVWRALRGADARGSFVTRPVGAALVVLVLAGISAAASRMVTPPEPPQTKPQGTAPAGAPNVILLMIDTLRADHLSAYGYQANKTPHIDALAADSLRCSHAFSQASWTRPSVATIMSGLYPSSHGAIHKSDVLPDRVETVAEVLSKTGYYTVGFPNNINVTAAFGFNQGFAEFHYLAPDLFFYANEPAAQLTLYNGLRLVRERFFARKIDVHNYYQPGEVVTAKGLEWLDTPAAKQGGPFFMYLHYMDPHDPYFVHPYNGEGYARVANPNPPADVAGKYRSLYDGEITYLDAEIGKLTDDLKKRGLYDKTVIVLTADHGEEFHEHGGWWHGTTLYDEQIHVPLVIKPAMAGGGRVIDDLCMSIDIAPTLIRAAGAAPPVVMQGHVLPLDGGAPFGRDHAFAEEDLEGNVLQAIRTQTSKYITANKGNPRGLPEKDLFDLSTDPGETKNLAGSDVKKLQEMEAALGKAYLAAKEHAGAGATTEMDSATKERLRQLGYIH
jgi:arylsulfatase A-like enzyme